MNVQDQQLLIQMLSDSLDHLINYNNMKESEYEQPYQHAPCAIDNSPINYDLTFKKQVRHSLITRQGTHNLSKNIFVQKQAHQNEEILEEIRNNDLSFLLQMNFNVMELQFLKESVEISRKTEAKINILITHAQLRANRQKRNSALMNFRILKGMHIQNKAPINQADQYRMYLLESLSSQYHKKIFIDSLKLNLWLTQYQAIEDSQEESSQNQFIKRDNNLDEYNKMEKQREQSSYFNVNRLCIFMQIFETLLDRRKFEYFKIIANYRLQQQEESELSREQEREELNEDNVEEEQIKMHRIKSIQAFIIDETAKIQQHPKNNVDIMRNYFTKWKIYFLMNMIKFIKNDPDISNSGIEPSPRIQYHPYHQQYIEEDTGSYLNTEMVSQQNNPLKAQKAKLRAFLKHHRSQQFLRILCENQANSRLKLMMKNLYKCNLLKRSFKALSINQKIEKYERQLSAYAEQISQNQINDCTVSIIFQRTTLLTKTFTLFVTLRKVSKITRILESINKRLTFRTALFTAREDSRYFERVQRFIYKRQKLLQFKYFNFLRSISPQKKPNIEKLKHFLQEKEFQKKEYYFSLLKLLSKLKLKNQMKITNLREQNNIKIFFTLLRENYEESLDFQERNFELLNSLKISRKQSFYRNLLPYRILNLENRKIEIKEEKLRTFLLWNSTQKCLKRWQMVNLQRKCYHAIEVRLTKYKQRQQRERMFKIWRERADGKSKRNNLKDSHKIWLQKYYEQLCTLQK